MLLESLRRKQIELSEIDEKFAPRLGMSRQNWGFLRKGKITFSAPVLGSVLVTFPDLKNEVDIFLLENASVNAKKASN